MSIVSILSMNGYGIYVWPTYFITLAVFGINLFITWREKKRIHKIISKYLAQS